MGAVGLHRGVWRSAEGTERSGRRCGLGCGSWQASGNDSAIGGCGHIFLRREKAEDGTTSVVGQSQAGLSATLSGGRAGGADVEDAEVQAEARVPLTVPTRANELWTMDYA